MSGLAYWLGLTDPSGAPYLFWSGAGGDLAKVTVPIALLIGVWRQMRAHRLQAKQHHDELLAVMKGKDDV